MGKNPETINTPEAESQGGSLKGEASVVAPGPAGLAMAGPYF